MMFRCLPVAALLACTVIPAQAATQAKTGYHQVAQVPLQDDDRWDYLAIDAAAHRLYITRATHVSVLDTTSNLVVGDIPDTQGVHGVALVPDLHKAFVSNGKDNSVSVIDLTTLKEAARVKAGSNPDAILFEPSTKRVFAFNGRDGSVTVIDAVSNAALGTIQVGGKLEFAATDGKGMVYDNIEDRNEMVAIDAGAMTLAHRWPLTECEAPSGLAMDVKTSRLFAACDNKKLAVVDSQSGKVVATPTIGAGPDAVVFDSSAQIVITPNGQDGTLSLIHEDTPGRYEALDTVKTQVGARTMALDPESHRLYLVTAKFGQTPAATANMPNPRPSIVPGSVELLIYDRE